jgi:hypothetical protein
MTEFVLPKWHGIESAMQDVKSTAFAKGVERLIGLKPNGDRVWDITGEATCVELPNDLANKDWEGNTDIFVVHGHPPIPCELSDGDLMFIRAANIAGNMAVSGVDDTVSWTPTYKSYGPLYTRTLLGMAQSRVLNMMGEYDNFHAEVGSWAETFDPRNVVLSHYIMKLLKQHLTPNYQCKLGDVALKMIEPWKERMAQHGL